MANKKLKGKDLFFEILRKNGITKIFGNPGTTEMPMINALNENPDFEYILNLHESAAVGVAAGYSMALNKPALVNVHTYSGLSNAICNIFNAFLAEVSLIITAGQQHQKFLAFNPTLSGPLTELVKTSVKSSEEVKHNYDLPIMLQRAINLCQQNPKSPTFLSLPLDLFEEEIDNYHDIGIPNIKTQEGIISIDEWKKIIDILINTNDIAIIIDQEAHEAFNELITLSEYLIADVYNTFFINRQVFDTSHYLYKGLLPFTAKEHNILFSKYKIIFIIGKQFDYLIYSNENSIPESCKVIHLNNSEDGINYNFKTDYTFVGDIKQSINTLNNLLKDKIDLSCN